MSRRDAFGDEVAENSPESFRTLFEKAGTGQKKLKVGDKFDGEILTIGKEEAFIATGTPTDAVIPLRDLMDENKQLKFEVGDRIGVVVLKIFESEIRVSMKNSKVSSADMESLEDAFDMEMPVEGKVLEPCNGGFRVQVLGKTAFCPVSQMDLRTSADPQAYVGQKFDFIITKFEESGRNLVVSRRKILELEKAEKEGEFLEAVKPGDLLDGVISKLEPFGAFVKLDGGVEGMVHISEISWSRIGHPEQVVRLGQNVKVKVLKVEEVDGRLRIGLSLKQGGGENDPWLEIHQKSPVGSIHDGIVDKKEVFGLFVRLATGYTGLLPKSKWRDSADGQQYESKKKGDTIRVRVDEIKDDERKVSLGLPTEAQDESWREHSGTQKMGTMADLFSQMKIGTTNVVKKK